MKKISIMLMVLVVALVSCKKTPEVNLKYVDVERDLVTVGTTTANIQCDYEYITTLKKAYLYYGEGENETNTTSAEMRVVQNTLYVELTGLKENTTYSYYYEFHNGFNSMRTALKSFKTEAGNGGGEEPPTPEIMPPTVITASVTEITVNSAKGGGEVTNDGGSEVTERGICWSMSANPTSTDHHLAVGSGTGSFTAMMDSLQANTTYHVRAYAINEKGTAYGLDKEFTTLSGGSSVPEGAINGLFTINENGDQVYFSQGNLQYQASTNTWRFAENQWNFVGGNDNVSGNEYGNVYENGVKCSNNNISATYNGWIDLFGWGTSGWNNGNLYYRPYDSERVFNPEMGYGYGPTDGIHCTFDLSGDYANADWGVYNAISNGGDMPNQWRTPTLSELKYVFDDRTTASNIRYAKAVVNEIAGVVLLPDGWNASIYSLNNPNVSEAPFAGNAISASDWEKMETNGAVFFPVNGQRVGTSYNSYDYADGRYWSSTAIPNAGQQPYLMSFNPNYVAPQSAGISKDTGISVRLVQDANP